MATYQSGSLIRLIVAFKNAAGTATDPDTIVARYKRDGGTATSVTFPTSIVKASTGNYYLDITVSQGGEWIYRWEGTGALQAAAEGTFTVLSSSF